MTGPARLRRALAGPHPLALRVLADVACLIVLLSAALWALAWAQAGVVVHDPNVLTTKDVFLGVVGLITTIFTGFMAYKMAQMTATARMTADSQKKTEESTKRTEESTDKIHTAVNSERTAMFKKVDDLTEIIRGLTRDKATLSAEAHGAELSRAEGAAVAAFKVQVPIVVTPALPPASVPTDEIHYVFRDGKLIALAKERSP